MTTRTQQSPVTKAAVDQTAAMVAALGLPQAWQAVSAAAEDKIPAASKGPLLGSIAADQLSQAAGAVKADGLTPEVIDLLQTLLDLMRGQAQPAPPAMPAEGPPAVAMAAKAQGPSDGDVREAIQGALAEMFPAEDDAMCTRAWVVDIFPADSTVVFMREHGNYQIGYTFDPATGVATLTGQPAEVRRTYVPVGAVAAPEIEAAAKAGMLKGLPPPETDSLSFRQEQRDPPPLGAPQRKQSIGAGAEKGLPSAEQVEGGVLSNAEQDTDFRREADAFKADAQRKGLPPPETDSLRFGQEQRDPPPLGAPMRKAAMDLVLGRQDDIAPKTRPKVKTYHFRTAG